MSALANPFKAKSSTPNTAAVMTEQLLARGRIISESQTNFTFHCPNSSKNNLALLHKPKIRQM